MAAMQLSLKARAMRFLSLREHSRLELQRKLAPYAQEGDDIDALLDTLEAAKYLSQERFSESLIQRRAARYGNSPIVAELQSHGIAGERCTKLRRGWSTMKRLARARSGAVSSVPSRPTRKSATNKSAFCCSEVFRSVRCWRPSRAVTSMTIPRTAEPARRGRDVICIQC